MMTSPPERAVGNTPASVSKSREAGRLRLVVACDIRGSRESLKIPVRDISLGGIRIVTAEAREVGDVLDLVLRLPTRIEISAEVRWVKREEGRHLLGCRFLHRGESRQNLKDTLRDMASAIDSAARRVR